MGKITVPGAKAAYLAKFRTDEYTGADDEASVAYTQALIASGKTKSEAEQIILSDTYLALGWCENQEEADRYARIAFGDYSDFRDSYTSENRQKGVLEFTTEKLIEAIAKAGLLTNAGDNLVIYEYEKIRVITRSGEYKIQSRHNLKNRTRKLSWWKTPFWTMTFDDSRVLNVLYDDEKRIYIETRKNIDIDEVEKHAKPVHIKKINVFKLAKILGRPVFKLCEDCGHLFPANVEQERFCNACKKKRARESVRKTRGKEFIQNDDRTILSPVKGLIRCMNPDCDRLFPGVRAKYCPACKVAKWRDKKKGVH